MCLKASDILLKANATQKHLDLNVIAQTKVDGIIELSYANCFDVCADSRVKTLGFDVLSNLIAKLNYSIYDSDGEDVTRAGICKFFFYFFLLFDIEAYQCIFVNPYVCFAKNNNYLIMGSIYDGTWHCQLKMDECKEKYLIYPTYSLPRLCGAVFRLHSA